MEITDRLNEIMFCDSLIQLGGKTFRHNSDNLQTQNLKDLCVHPF